MSKHRNDGLEPLAAAFAALSSPQRLRMFVKLAARRRAQGFCCATEVGEGLDLAASTVSHHLRELRQAGLVHVERRGRRIHCRASQETLDRLASFFAEWVPPRSRAPRGRGACSVAARGGAR